MDYNIGFKPFLDKVYPYINSPKVIFDIGARECNESICFAEAFPEAKIFSFEPNPNQKDACEINSSRYPQITFSPIALSDKNGEMDFYIANGNVGASSLLKPHFIPWASDQSVSVKKVKVETLDSFCNKNNVYPDVIWMDVQGNELNTLKGGANALSSVKAIYTEAGVKPYYDGHTLKPDIVKFLSELGFRLIDEKLDWEMEANLIFVRK